MSANFNTLYHGSLDDLVAVLNGPCELTLAEHRAALANIATKLGALSRSLQRPEPAGQSLCSMRDCEEPIHRAEGASGAFCAVHEREMREEEAARVFSDG